MEKNMNYKN